MKPAEEWWDDTLPGSFSEVETKFRDGSEIIEWVKQIQADALSEAAEIAGRQVQRDMECCPYFNDGLQAGRNEARDAILAKVKELEP